jgi:hypothetical protein
MDLVCASPLNAFYYLLSPIKANIEETYLPQRYLPLPYLKTETQVQPVIELKAKVINRKH